MKCASISHGCGETLLIIFDICSSWIGTTAAECCCWTGSWTRASRSIPILGSLSWKQYPTEKEQGKWISKAMQTTLLASHPPLDKNRRGWELCVGYIPAHVRYYIPQERSVLEWSQGRWGWSPKAPLRRNKSTDLSWGISWVLYPTAWAGIQLTCTMLRLF